MQQAQAQEGVYLYKSIGTTSACFYVPHGVVVQYAEAHAGRTDAQYYASTRNSAPTEETNRQQCTARVDYAWLVNPAAAAHGLQYMYIVHMV